VTPCNDPNISNHQSNLLSYKKATFCISIAFLLNSIPIIGVIHAPLLHTTFSSLKGHGAWQDHHSPHPDIFPARKLPYINQPKKPIPANAPKGCVFGCEWGKDRRDLPGGNMTRKVESFVNLATEIGGRGGKGGMVHGVRSLGR
jgi:myo-inositol-1(or 4)-monophosphatase